MTQKQQQAFDFIQRYMAEHRFSPLIREIQVGCNIASYKSVLDRLNALERRGLIKRAPNKHRGIKVVRKAAEGLQQSREAQQAPEAQQSAGPLPQNANAAFIQ